MTTDDYLQELRFWGALLVSPDELWGTAEHPSIADGLALLLDDYRDELSRRLAQCDISVCPSPTWHRSSWCYAGEKRFVCDVCARIAV